MNRKLLATLIAGLATAGIAGSALAGAPTVYGKINVSLQQNDYEQVATTGALPRQIVDEIDNWRLESNASRIGVKGDYDISGSLKAIYKIEYEIAVDDGLNSNDREFSARNVAGGLQGSLGTILFGRHDTPLKLIQEKVDRFNDAQLADIQNYIIGENRIDNIVLYSSPSLSGFQVTLAAAPGEQSGTGTSDDNDGPADYKSVAVSYGLGKPLYLAIAHEDNIAPNSTLTAGSTTGAADITRFVVDYTVGPVKLGGIYQTAERHDNDGWLPNININGGAIGQFTGGNSGARKQDGWVLNGEWAFAPQWAAKLQYGYSETKPINSALDDAETTLIAAGVDYLLNKNSRIYGYYASLEIDGDNSLSTGKPKDQTIGVGYDFSF